MIGKVLGIVLTTGVTLGLSGCGGGGIGCDNRTVSGGPSGGQGISVGSGNSGTCNSADGGGGSGGNGSGGTVQLGTPLDTVYYVKTGVAPTISAVGIDSAKNFLPLTNFTPTSIVPDDHPGMAIVNSHLLYLAAISEAAVLGFAIDAGSGDLTPVPGSPFSTNANSMTIDGSGRFLYVGNGANSTIVGFHIDATSGTLTPVPGSPFATQGMRFVNAMTTDGLGHLLYVTEGVGGSNMNAFFINSANGALTPVAGNPVSLPVSFLKSEPSGRFLVGINDKTGTSGVPSDTNVYVFSIDQSTGLITQVPLSPFATPLPPIQLFVHPNGRFIYTANDNLGGGQGPVQGFTLDSTGNVTPMSGSPFSNLAPVEECEGDHTTGTELMCTDGSTFFAFDIDSNTGNLSRVAAPFVAGQNQPFAVTAPQ